MNSPSATASQLPACAHLINVIEPGGEALNKSGTERGGTGYVFKFGLESVVTGEEKHLKELFSQVICKIFASFFYCFFIFTCL